MGPEDKTAIKLMIAALDAYSRARAKVSGLGWAQIIGYADKSYRQILLFDDIEKLAVQMLAATEKR
jgi:hypothetical protein